MPVPMTTAPNNMAVGVAAMRRQRILRYVAKLVGRFFTGKTHIPDVADFCQTAARGIYGGFRINLGPLQTVQIRPRSQVF